MTDLDIVVDLSSSLVIAWERGRLAANEELFRELRDVLNRMGALGFYGLLDSIQARWDWESSG